MWPVVCFIQTLAVRGPPNLTSRLESGIISEAKELLAKENEVVGYEAGTGQGRRGHKLPAAWSIFLRSRLLTIAWGRASFLASFGKFAKPAFTSYASVLSHFSAGVCPVLDPPTISAKYLL